jgi:hypothetical protein
MGDGTSSSSSQVALQQRKPPTPTPYISLGASSGRIMITSTQYVVLWCLFTDRDSPTPGSASAPEPLASFKSRNRPSPGLGDSNRTRPSDLQKTHHGSQGITNPKLNASFPTIARRHVDSKLEKDLYIVQLSRRVEDSEPLWVQTESSPANGNPDKPSYRPSRASFNGCKNKAILLQRLCPRDGYIFAALSICASEMVPKNTSGTIRSQDLSRHQVVNSTA